MEVVALYQELITHVFVRRIFQERIVKYVKKLDKLIKTIHQKIYIYKLLIKSINAQTFLV